VKGRLNQILRAASDKEHTAGNEVHLVLHKKVDHREEGDPKSLKTTNLELCPVTKGDMAYSEAIRILI
jgi:hypothetical protein